MLNGLIPMNIEMPVHVSVQLTEIYILDSSNPPKTLARPTNGCHAQLLVTALNNYASIEQENQRLKEQVNTWATRAEAYKQAAEFSELGAKRAEQENQKLREALKWVSNEVPCPNYIRELAQQALATDNKEKQ